MSRSVFHRVVAAGQLLALTDTEEWRVPQDETVSRPPKGYVISFMAFHEHGFSVPARRFIRALLFEYALQLQHLNPNSVQQMAALEVLYEGHLGIDTHCHLFKYFFKFARLKDDLLPVTIGCANLRMKQGRGNTYIPFSSTCSNNGWHKGWFYLKNDPDHALPEFTGFSIAKASQNWSDGPPTVEQERLMKEH
jgi:hypothetical protein